MSAPPESRREGRNGRNRLTRSAGVVSAAVMASRVLGLAREVVLAHLFATGLALDAFHAAFRIPNMLRDLFGEGALSKAFVTSFAESDLKRGEAETWRLASRVYNLLLIFSVAAAVLGIVFAPYLVAAIFPGEGFDQPLPPNESYGFSTKRELTVFLTRVMFPFLPLVSMAAISMGVLNSRNRFGVPALTSAFFNVGSIVVGVLGYLFGPRFGIHPVVGMAVGVLVGGLLQWLIQVPQIRSLGYRWRPEVSLRDPGVRRIGALLGPAIVGAAAVQINVFVNSVFASLGASWLSWINASFRLMYLPIGIFGVAVSTANLPALARLAAGGERAEFRETLSHAMRLILLLTIPSSVGLAVLSTPIIRLIYEHGAFTVYDAEMTGAALFYYALGLAGYSAVKVVTDAFYALNDTMTPLKISLGAIAINIGLSFLFIHGLGWDHRGLALAMSVAVMGNFLAALAVLRLKIGGVDGWTVLGSTARILVASLGMGAVCLVVSGLFEGWLGTAGTLGQLVQVGVTVLVGVVVFGLLARLLHVRELDELIASLRVGGE